MEPRGDRRNHRPDNADHDNVGNNNQNGLNAPLPPHFRFEPIIPAEEAPKPESEKALEIIIGFVTILCSTSVCGLVYYLFQAQPQAVASIIPSQLFPDKAGGSSFSINSLEALRRGPITTNFISWILVGLLGMLTLASKYRGEPSDYFNSVPETNLSDVGVKVGVVVVLCLGGVWMVGSARGMRSK